MKIAFVSDNGKNVSQHFGRARYYVVVTVENGQVVKNETRDKLGHIQFASDAHHEEYHGPLHGYGPEAQHRHGKIIEVINDCEVLVGGKWDSPNSDEYPLDRSRVEGLHRRAPRGSLRTGPPVITTRPQNRGLAE